MIFFIFHLKNVNRIHGLSITQVSRMYLVDCEANNAFCVCSDLCVCVCFQPIPNLFCNILDFVLFKFTFEVLILRKVFMQTNMKEVGQKPQIHPNLQLFKL